MSVTFLVHLVFNLSEHGFQFYASLPSVFQSFLRAEQFFGSPLVLSKPIFHFKEEEALQEKAGYPDRDKHHEKHEEFKKTIQELYEYLHDSEGPTDQFSELVHRNVVDWLFGHIKTFDRSVAEFIFMRENPERC